MRGNSHVRFSGGKGVAILLTYPIRTTRSRMTRRMTRFFPWTRSVQRSTDLPDGASDVYRRRATRSCLKILFDVYMLCSFDFKLFKSTYQRHRQTCCFANSSLFGHAIGVIRWCEAPKTMQPTEEIPRGRNKSPNTMGLGARLER